MIVKCMRCRKLLPESRMHKLIEYLDEHKWELEYQEDITNDNSSLAFFHYATKQLRE